MDTMKVKIVLQFSHEQGGLQWHWNKTKHRKLLYNSLKGVVKCLKTLPGLFSLAVTLKMETIGHLTFDLLYKGVVNNNSCKFKSKEIPGAEREMHIQDESYCCH